MKFYRFRLDQPPITPNELKAMRRFTSAAIALVVLTCISLFLIGSGLVHLLLLPSGFVLLFLLHSTTALRDADADQENKLVTMRENGFLDEAHLGFVQQVAQLSRRLTYGEARGLIEGAREAEMKRRRSSLYETHRAER
ncbi:hypothetical protein PAERUG_P40_Scotland_4_VIM_2_09_12_04113 [Pseudomonas aeruginosa]|nr:hypothetical protein [Pseudomonas aeruginosa]CRN67129.1 hypothetical protein PAERUG_P40_Scotland_4_VIM_2_09_12_04113 [Pseudomonas aeruginosa]